MVASAASILQSDLEESERGAKCFRKTAVDLVESRSPRAETSFECVWMTSSFFLVLVLRSIRCAQSGLLLCAAAVCYAATRSPLLSDAEGLPFEIKPVLISI